MSQALNSLTHGKSRSPIYSRWQGMKDRCLNPKNPRFADYGGRGITVCERWMKFENFYMDMGDVPSAEHQLDRRDNSKGYSPENCRWATRQEQQNNMRSNRILTFNETSKTVTQWADCLGLKANTIVTRLQRGWSVDVALMPPGKAPRQSANYRRGYIKDVVTKSGAKDRRRRARLELLKRSLNG